LSLLHRQCTCLNCGITIQAAEYHSERSLPTVIGILVNATFVDAALNKLFAHCKSTGAQATEARLKLLDDGGNR
jgi:hypothetical protein